MGSLQLRIKDTELTYNAVQFHFHTPSEHTFMGKHYPLELHIVHTLLQGPPGYTHDKAVIAVFFDDTEDVPSQFIEALNPEKPGSVLVKPIDVSELLKNMTKFYYYQGSLTTPPCTEVVNWVVMTEPQKISKKQVQQMRAIWEPELEGCCNNRETQPINQRTIYKSHP